MDEKLRKCFQRMDFVIVPSGSPGSDELEIHVLNTWNVKEDWKNPDWYHLNCQSLHGRKLMFKSKERRAKKVLYFHWLVTVLYWMEACNVEICGSRTRSP
jgi:hypothetical protein